MTDTDNSEMNRLTRDAPRISRTDGKLDVLTVITPVNAHEIRIRPMTYGVSKRYDLAHRKVTDLDDDEKCELIRHHVVDPDFSDLTVDEMTEEWDWSIVDDLCMAVAIHSRSRFRRRIEELAPSGNGSGSDPTKEPPLKGGSTTEATATSAPATSTT